LVIRILNTRHGHPKGSAAASKAARARAKAAGVKAVTKKINKKFFIPTEAEGAVADEKRELRAAAHRSPLGQFGRRRFAAQLGFLSQSERF
jgi:hypothetical protein